MRKGSNPPPPKGPKPPPPPNPPKVHRCNISDDADVLCNREVSNKQWRQDGMCERCANLLWNNFFRPMQEGKKVKPILFKENP